MRHLALLLCAAIAASLYAQEPHSCRISLAVGVSDHNTFQPVVGLMRDSFEVRSGKQIVHPDRVDSILTDRIFLFIDASGSMTTSENRNWPLVKITVRELLDRIPAYLPVITHVFAMDDRRLDRRVSVVPFLESYASDRKTKPALGGRTRLYDTLRAVTQSDETKIGDMVVLVTDGGDNQSKSSLEDTVREFNKIGTRVVVLYISEHSGVDSSNFEEQVGQEDLLQLAKSTGGLVYRVRKYEEHQPRLIPQEFFANVLTYYRLQFDSAKFADQKIRVALLGADRKALRNSEVRTASRAPSCSRD